MAGSDRVYNIGMRRWAFIAAMVSLLTTLPAVAQRGGGHGFGGGAGRSFAGMRATPTRPAFSGMSHSQSFGTFHSGVHHTCNGCFFHNPNRIFFRSSRFFGYPFYGYYSSPWMWDSSSSYSQDDQYESERALTRQIDDLNQEVERLREQQDQRAYSSAPSRAEENPAPTGVSRTPAESRKDLPTILVFRDQHIQEVQNYAIMGKNLVVVAEQRSTKIPLDKLDLSATAKLNDERGVDFQVPR